MKRVVFREERCKGCELCVEACPEDIIHLADRLNANGYHPAMVRDEDQDKCTSCGLCARMCPDLVITVYRPARVKAS